MRFYNRQHQYYCGIDLHVKTMYVCILDTAGQVLVHRNVPSTPAAFLEVVARQEDLRDLARPESLESGVGCGFHGVLRSGRWTLYEPHRGIGSGA